MPLLPQLLGHLARFGCQTADQGTALLPPEASAVDLLPKQRAHRLDGCIAQEEKRQKAGNLQSPRKETIRHAGLQDEELQRQLEAVEPGVRPLPPGNIS